MSFAEMMEQVEALDPLERRELSLRLLELGCTREELDDIAICEHSAALGFAMLDEMEARDAGE